jgi:hypothetical protein
MRDWKVWLTVERTELPDVQNIYWRNGKHIGAIVKDVDGYWKYSCSGSGLWDDGPLHMLADMLTELNAEWHKEVTEYFEND